MVAAAPNEADVDVHHVRHAEVIFFFLVFVFVAFFSIILQTIVMFIFFFYLLGWFCSNC